MRFVLASWGSRGEVEPCAAVGRELLRRGHEVQMAVPPDLIDFTESAGIPAVAYGPKLQDIVDAYRDYWTCLFRTPWKIRELVRLNRAISTPRASWAGMSTTLTALTKDADLLFTSNLAFERLASNVAEHQGIPLATLHWFPTRANGQVLPSIPAPLLRRALTVYEWLSRGGSERKVDAAQRRALGLPKAKGPWPWWIAARGGLEIQAYDEACFPGLAAEWAKWGDTRPFIGTLTMELPTDVDEEVASWISAGTPPIFFGFGSMPIKSPADTIAMIAGACAQLGERALVGTAGVDFEDVPAYDHVKVVGAVNYATVFPACRAVVHHGGTGTTALGLRAGVPTLILSTDMHQTLWGAQLKRLKVGAARRFSATNEKTLTDDLRTILAPRYSTNVRELSKRLATPAESVAGATDLLEELAGRYARTR
ncbi:glycosyltransferase [Mycolicibacterium parafortuitum]|uniref:Glycosyl transferase family protein [Mycobacterium leprae TN] n=1 Tax=Mycolicibacterium parafortuitum TaxID=39692 RepID=A0A375YMN6_MYCPF|nr:glycosyltransferase [Mycolicibacterium parafortuitum]ORB27085.1 glycosyl transferase family 1 [Mycolicibacterium parafortuitum]SRX82244.1 glycosyl transferase family protein [Mycobacterium leprae TN] [Mycolicibacterium parafortuitum]